MSVAQAGNGLPVAVGDKVFVRHGLDVLEGQVVDRYESGAGARVVVRLAVSEESDRESQTVAVSEADVYPANERSQIEPPGTWVSAAYYERMVMQAVHRALNQLRMRATIERHGRGEPDLVVRTPDSTVVVEAKFTQRSELGGDVAERIGSQLDRFDLGAGKLLVSNAVLPDRALKVLRAHFVQAVTWRSDSDDAALVTALDAVLGGAAQKR